MEFIAKTLYGLEDVLASELVRLGASGVRKLNRAVAFEGDLALMYRANWELRTALSILRVLTRFRINKAEDIREFGVKIQWEDYMMSGQTFAISTTSSSTLFRHNAYAGLLLKDAIADRFMLRFNKRPNVDTRNPDLLFNLHVREKEVTVSADSSHLPLFKRGYRVFSGPASLNEVLAAGLVLLSGWKGETKLYDPMCGSGTIAIEAALILGDIPPGLFRKSFGFMNWPDYNSSLFNKIKEKPRHPVKKPEKQVFCSDISANSLRGARDNIRSSGTESYIKSYPADFFETDSSGETLTIITNPPYGKRMKEDDLEVFYGRVGERLKHGYAGCDAWIFSSGNAGVKRLGLKPTSKTTLYNGSIECKLSRYEMYSGSHKRS